ncbi:acetolactate decarboxylase [Kaistia soli DSM 19436]|uniref:Alpha-acetolactate decarboxylase n=1 Tax=Kaistia soli DSM 19436 TaxID=1122133 RepID=A0A1M4W8M2_9HYPH|nr:acetolactate decarboxylase [Kaistia soli]SHE77520.1 acetolactate decarboxylase [Kaistia soli DSM 19436]
MNIKLPTSLRASVHAEMARSGRSLDAIVRDALASYFETSLHTVFQVSTSGALVAGVYDREASVETILDHGDFGLGTFTGLDGEMIILEGHAYHADVSGTVTEAPDDAGVPFAIVTRFTPEQETLITSIASFAELEALCDPFRASGNIFYALRLDGRFAAVKARAVSPPPPGTKLVDAVKTQHEFTLTDVDGTLVGIWSPEFSGPFSVAGYHFHFISRDRRQGGHVLDVHADHLRLQVEPLSNFHLALPETEAYLKAHISGDTAAALAFAEHDHQAPGA